MIKIKTEHGIFKGKYANEWVVLTRLDQEEDWGLHETRSPFAWEKKQGAARRSSGMNYYEAEREVEEKIIPNIKVYRNVEKILINCLFFREEKRK